MDGLASGVSLIATLSLGTIAALNGNPFVVLFCIALSGSLLAFLRYNWHPAQIFLGDTGSMFLGFVLASVSLMGAYKSQGAVLVLGAVMALGIPIFETFISMLRRYLGGFPIFSADSRHTHHRLLRKGMTQHQAAIILYAGGLLCFAASVLSVLLPAGSFSSLIPVAVFIVTLIGIAAIAGYTTTIAVKFRRRQETLRRLAFAKYASMTLIPGVTPPSVRHVMDLMCREFELNFVVVLFAEGARRITSSGLPEDPNIVVHPHSVERFNVKASDGSHVEVLYQHNYDAGYIGKHIVASCLANIFEGINSNLPTEIVGPSEGDKLRAPSAAS
jgi:UDP-N-acetylmuramyl pentapeptide phosphotransferase/UDP-N-acetylglucosamine-1-phosphate transferase